jgi:glutathione S-transferase
LPSLQLTYTLYSHPLASYCHKVLIALYENEIAFEKRTIDLGNAADRADLSALWPLCKIPVLHDHARGRSVTESSIIIEYLDQVEAPAHRMLPADPATALEVRLWDRVLDIYVQGPMQEIVFDKIRNANADMTTARATLQTAYAMLDQQLATTTSPASPWLVGPDFTLADCAAAPGLFFACTLEGVPAEQVHLHAYFESLMARPSVQRVLTEAKPYLPFYPFHSAIAARFL